MTFLSKLNRYFEKSECICSQGYCLWGKKEQSWYLIQTERQIKSSGMSFFLTLFYWSGAVRNAEVTL